MTTRKNITAAEKLRRQMSAFAMRTAWRYCAKYGVAIAEALKKSWDYARRALKYGITFLQLQELPEEQAASAKQVRYLYGLSDEMGRAQLASWAPDGDLRGDKFETMARRLSRVEVSRAIDRLLENRELVVMFTA